MMYACLFSARHASHREASTFLYNVAHTAADHAYLESGGHRGQVVLQVLETRPVLIK
jgi:hypothetical protein